MHTWSSLVSTLFMLFPSLSGLLLVVGLATLAGLLAALLHEGAGWVAAWLALSLPLVLAAWQVGKAYFGRAYAPRNRVARRT